MKKTLNEKSYIDEHCLRKTVFLNCLISVCPECGESTEYRWTECEIGRRIIVSGQVCKRCNVLYVNKIDSNKSKKNSTVHYSLRQIDNWRYTKRIVSVNVLATNCKYCEGLLIRDFTLIPNRNSNRLGYEVVGLKCPKCDVLFVTDKVGVRRILIDNTKAKGFTLDGEQLEDYSRKKKEVKKTQRIQSIFSNLPDAIAIVGIRTESDEFRVIKIRNTEPEAYTDYSDNTDVPLKSEIAREILTAACHSSREGKGRLNGTSFAVTECYFKDESNRTSMSSFVAKSINIRLGASGGYYSTRMKNKEEIIALLLYSPYTKRYECINATFDTVCEDSYIDYKAFRDFVYKYGKPDIPINFKNYGGRGFALSFDDFNKESILKLAGYSVSQKDSLSDSKRREILKDLVDLEILTVSDIVRHIDFCMSVHSGDMYCEAQCKWESDKEYISNYKANPQRFLIADCN